MPVSLSDAELAIVMAAAKPLLARDRDPFLRVVYDALLQLPSTAYASSRS